MDGIPPLPEVRNLREGLLLKVLVLFRGFTAPCRPYMVARIDGGSISMADFTLERLDRGVK
jgi:hypothetical protein